MKKAQQKVLEFQNAMGQELDIDLQYTLCREELIEVFEAIRHDDPYQIAKETADLVYVALGLANAAGVDLERVFNDVHESNMSKIGGEVRADGKILKPRTYKPAFPSGKWLREIE